MRRLASTLFALSLVVAACASDEGANDDTTTTSPEVTTTSSASPATEAPTTTEGSSGGGQLGAASTDLGEIVVDDDGFTLYMFVPDAQGDSVCEGECATNWPPVTEARAAGDGIDASLIGEAGRPDGSTQVTYAGWPLYRFAGDSAAGDTNGQGINDVWYVIQPDGTVVGFDG